MAAISFWRNIEFNSTGLITFTGENSDGSILTKSLTIDGFSQLNKILYENKKTFVCGRVSTGKTLIMKYILKKLNQEISPAFILSKNNKELTEEISQYPLPKIIELNEHSTRNTVLANENEYKEVIPFALDIEDYNFIVQDELLKYSETINNLFRNNKNTGYLTTMHIGRLTMIGFARNEVEEAVVFLNQILQKNNKTFLDEPIVLIATDNALTREGTAYSLKVFSNKELHDINKKIPDEYRNVSYSRTEAVAQMATKSHLTEVRKSFLTEVRDEVKIKKSLKELEDLNKLNAIKAVDPVFRFYEDNIKKTFKTLK